MRFSFTIASLFTLFLSSKAVSYDPAYIHTFGVETDSRGRLGRSGAPLVFDDSGTVYMANSTNNVVDTLVHFVFGVMTNVLGELTPTAKLVEYPGYSTDDRGIYLTQPAGGHLAYNTFNENPGTEFGPWWLQSGPSNDPQYRLTFNGNETAMVLWDETKGRYNVYIGDNIPADRVQDMIPIDLKVTEYCGPNNEYCF